MIAISSRSGWGIPVLVLIAARLLVAQTLHPPRFEAAAIRPLEGPQKVQREMKISGTRVTFQGYNTAMLVMEAFDLRRDQLNAESLSSSGQDVYYRIEARVAGQNAVGEAEVRKMLQTLLAERFHLVIHRETRNTPVYALVADKNGPALKAGSGAGECANSIGPVRPEDRNYRYRFTNCTLEPFLRALMSTTATDRPILDKTGLKGRYDIEIFATPEFKMTAGSEPGDISFLDAVRKLGLRLEKQNEPVEVVVIDRVDSSPSAN